MVSRSASMWARGGGSSRELACDGEQSLPRVRVLDQDGADGTVLGGLEDRVFGVTGRIAALNVSVVDEDDAPHASEDERNTEAAGPRTAEQPDQT